MEEKSRSRVGMRGLIRVTSSVILTGLLLWSWYAWNADYGYSAVSGTYTFEGGSQRASIVLTENGMFRQELSRAGRQEHADGTWRRVGEGGVVFSKEFLPVRGQVVRQDGQADGQVEKSFAGFRVSIVFEGGAGFRRR